MTDLVSGNGHPVYDPEIEAARVLACLVEMFLQGHEDNHHNGDYCIDTRISLSAYIAHCVGVREHEHVDKMCELIANYEEAH